MPSDITLRNSTSYVASHDHYTTTGSLVLLVRALHAATATATALLVRVIRVATSRIRTTLAKRLLQRLDISKRLQRDLFGLLLVLGQACRC